MTTAEKRQRLLDLVTPTCEFFGDMRGVDVLREASDAALEDIWRTNFATWWEIEQRNKPQ